MQFVYIAAVVLISLTIHEVSHAYVSYRLGDPTAKMMGRLTLNPLKHLDPLGTIMMAASAYFGAGFGWAKPVPIDPSYYKNYKRGTMLVSVAGPLSNLALAFLASFPIVYLGLKYYNVGLAETDYRIMIFRFCYMMLYANINLAIFNLIPVPPLDGSKILAGILPARLYFYIMKYENYIGVIFIIILFAFPSYFTDFLLTVTSPIRYLMLSAAEIVLRLFI